jgi:hypothetical protein
MRTRVVLGATVFDTYFAGQIATLNSIAAAPSVVDMDTKRMAAYFKNVQSHGQGAQPLFTAARLDRPRRNSGVSDRFPNGSGSNVADRAYFKAVKATGKPYISAGLVTRIGQRRVVIMAVPTRTQRRGQRRPRRRAPGAPVRHEPAGERPRFEDLS